MLDLDTNRLLDYIVILNEIAPLPDVVPERPRRRQPERVRVHYRFRLGMAGSSIDFEWYRSFISIDKHRSVSAAAQARILTQPAMSWHLAALEAEIGEPLFIRAPAK